MKTVVKFDENFKKFTKSEWTSPLLNKYGEFLTGHPFLLISLSIILTLLLSLGGLRFRVKDDLRFMYTPPGSPSFTEYQIHMNFQNSNYSHAYVDVAVVAPNGGNILTEEIANIIINANGYIFTNFTIPTFMDGMDGEEVNFANDLCPRLGLCPESNKIVEIFLESYFDPDDGYRAGENCSKKHEPDGEMGMKNEFTYPSAIIYGIDVFLASHFYGITEDKLGNIKEINHIHLLYFYPIENDDDHRSIEAFESNLMDYFQQIEWENKNRVHFILASMRMLQKAVEQNTIRTMPFLPISIIILVMYTLWTTIIKTDPVGSKPMEGLMGVCTTLLAVVSAFGLVLALGVPYNSTVAVVPFLTLALAVDDTYIMLAGWRDTCPNMGTEKRMGLVFIRAGCAITVAMLTDVFSFSVGAFSNTPAIEHFCLFIVAAVLFDYLYQFTFFSAFLAISGKREESGRHCLFFWLPASKAPFWRAPTPTMISDFPTITQFGKHSPSRGYCELFLKRTYYKILMSKKFRIIACIVYVLYVIISLWGCINLEVNLSPQKLLMRDSELSRYTKEIEKYVWPGGIIAFVYIKKSPNFDSSVERHRFEEFVQALESTAFSSGHDSTALWYIDYISFLDHLQIDLDDPSIEKDIFYKRLASFLNLDDKKRWNGCLRFTNSTWNSDRNMMSHPGESSQSNSMSHQDESSQRNPMTHHDDSSPTIRHSLINFHQLSDIKLNLDSFYFTTGFHLTGWDQLLDMVSTWRSICANYSEYEAIVFNENNFYADQIRSLAPNVIQDTGIAFFCMILAGAFFIPNFLILFWVTWSLFSMNLGVIGLLAWLGCDLDPSAVTSILLSIGLTVDYTVHVAYHFYKCMKVRSDVKSGEERKIRREILEETLATAGWPLIQGGLSTILAMIVLFLVPSYVIEVFLATVLLVVVLGLLHALIYLPMFLASVSLDLPRRKRVCVNGM